MEIRVLRYFLIVAREENITKAAEFLHLTQPTLSRQLMQLEDELGVKLFHRSKHRIILTEDGILLKRRAEEIVTLADKTKDDLFHKHDELTGSIAIGSGELKSSHFLAKLIADFQKKNPLVKFTFYSGNSDNIKDRLERGLLDIGLLQEPIDITKYNFIRTPIQEKWGAYVNIDSPLAKKEALLPKDLAKMPLILPERENLQNEIRNWFGPYAENLKIVATGNLLYNLIALAKEDGSCVMTLDMDCYYHDMRFIPLYPEIGTRTVIVWKKEQPFSATTNAFITHLKNAKVA